MQGAVKGLLNGSLDWEDVKHGAIGGAIGGALFGVPAGVVGGLTGEQLSVVAGAITAGILGWYGDLGVVVLEIFDVI